MKEKMKVAVVGCGTISEIYLKNMINNFTGLEVAACCDVRKENAEKRAEQFGILARSFEDILEDPSIEMVVVLTPAFTHYDIIRQALLAGKHVYTEKTMTISLKDAEELLQIANEKGVYLGSSPDTFLGSALQTARQALDDGIIGEVTSFQVNANRDLDLIGSIFKIIRDPGAGICYDYGVYYLTALVSLLGPAKRVAAIVKNRNRIRKNIWKDSPEYGQEFEYPNESQVMAVLEMESGVSGNFCLNGDSIVNDLADFRILGTKGVLKLTDCNCFGGKVRFIPNDLEGGVEEKEQVLDCAFSFSENSRGIGPAEMANAIRQGKQNRTNKEMAYHVLEIISRIMESNKTGKFETIESVCSRPEVFTNGKELVE